MLWSYRVEECPFVHCENITKMLSGREFEVLKLVVLGKRFKIEVGRRKSGVNSLSDGKPGFCVIFN